MKTGSPIYLDHAATSWPKPERVSQSMLEILNGPAANSGRGNYRMAMNAGRSILQTRTALAQLLQVDNANDIVFTSNTTEALNLAIKGCLREGDHVVATMIEHNSVRRPLEYLKRIKGIQVDYIPVSAQGILDLAELKERVTSQTRLVVCAHSSNLLGSILPVEEIGKIAHAAGALLLIDAAQTIGCYPVDVKQTGADMIAFPGHKSLLGPQGTGGLYIRPDLELEPLLHGGTGSQSEAVEMPKVRPDQYEAGTLNTVGIAGLGAGVRTVMEYGIEKIYQHEWQLTQQLMQGLLEIKGLTCLGPELGVPRTGLVAFTLEGWDAAEVAFRLDRQYQISVRAGYHCTPLGHMSAGTTGRGAVRASVGYSTTVQEIEALISAMKQIAQ